jgi:hypothetical protein
MLTPRTPLRRRDTASAWLFEIQIQRLMCGAQQAPTKKKNARGERAFSIQKMTWGESIFLIFT